jgi:hypothetical protein
MTGMKNLNDKVELTPCFLLVAGLGGPESVSDPETVGITSYVPCTQLSEQCSCS